MKKAILSVMLGAAVVMSSVPVMQAQAASVCPTTSDLYVNNEQVSCNAYNIDGNNYYKLRDLAYILNGSDNGFSVNWDGDSNTVSLVSDNSYTPVGGECSTNIQSIINSVVPSAANLVLNNVSVSADSYNVDGNNYYKLRDIAELLGFDVDWSAEDNRIDVTTDDSSSDSDSSDSDSSDSTNIFGGIDIDSIINNFKNNSGGSSSDTSNQNTTVQESDNSSSTEFAQEVLDLVNAERAKAGVGALTLDSSLTSAATTRANELNTSFSHTRPNGSSAFTVLSENNISYRTCGENIAIGYATPEAVVNGWMNSEGHRANILNGNFTKMGLGYAQTTGSSYQGYAWAQLFIG